MLSPFITFDDAESHLQNHSFILTSHSLKLKMVMSGYIHYITIHNHCKYNNLKSIHLRNELLFCSNKKRISSAKIDRKVRSYYPVSNI